MPAILCPTAEQLAAFQAGKLNHDNLSRIAEHLETCASCQTALLDGSTLGDTLVQELKQAQQVDAYTDEPGCRRAISKIEALAIDAATHTSDETRENVPLVPLMPATGPPIKANESASRLTALALSNPSVPDVVNIATSEILMVPALLMVPPPNVFDPSTFQMPPLLLLKVAVARLTLPVMVPELLTVLLPLKTAKAWFRGLVENSCEATVPEFVNVAACVLSLLI